VTTTPLLSTEQCLAAIEHHSAALAQAARRDLSARVRHCPDWDVADLVWHLTGVHWFWAGIAEERPAELPRHLTDEGHRPSRPADPDELLAGFESGARRLVEVLRAADQDAACWTWAPEQQDVAFITRHQVQEAAVHHWDVTDAVRTSWAVDAEVAADAVEEFLTFSVSSDADPADPPRPPLGGAVWFCACVSDSPQAWTWLVTDGRTPGTTVWHRLDDGNEPDDLLAPGTAMVGGHADPADVLLWLYGRVRHPFVSGPDGDTELLERLRALTFTD
jgi:uncharacterized protein (TIGR03083 family)